MTASLDPCDRCVTGYFVAYCTKRIGTTGLSRRYLRCNNPDCDQTAKEVVPSRRLPDLVNSRLRKAGTRVSNGPKQITNP